jgi:hypothetical protein
MTTPVDNIVTPWICVRPPKYRAEVSSLEARRMLAKLGELHQPVLPRPAKNPGAAWGNTCLDGLLTVKIRQPSHEFTFGVGMSFIPYPLVLTPVV